jgi:iron complex transport system ATP-binding protein
MTIAKAASISVKLGGTTILDDITLDVNAGEVLALVGPNGAGKSTLLAALTGDVAVTSGTVMLAGRPLQTLSAKESARVRSAMLQETTISFPFSVREIVTMGRSPWRGTSHEDEDAAAIAEAMRHTDVVHLASRRFTSLSGGEKARVTLARTLAQRTRLLLLDEPTAALDIRHQELVMAVARQRADAGDGVVIVMHDLNLAAAHADRVAVLSRGRVSAVGPPRAVLTSDLLSAVYEHRVDVLPHPQGNIPIVLPTRPARTTNGRP